MQSRVTRLKEIGEKFSPHEIQMYRDHFSAFDLNKDGVISTRELEKVSTQLGYRLTETDIQVRGSKCIIRQPTVALKAVLIL